MGDTGVVTTAAREPRWLLMPLLGMLSGGVFGVLVVWLAVLIVALTGEPTRSVVGYVSLSVVGGIQGAVVGLVCGVPVALALLLAVRRGETGPRVTRRVLVVASVTQLLTLLVLMTAIGFGFVGFGTLLLLLSPVVAGLVARWFHARVLSEARPGAAGAR